MHTCGRHHRDSTTDATSRISRLFRGQSVRDAIGPKEAHQARMSGQPIQRGGLVPHVIPDLPTRPAPIDVGDTTACSSWRTVSRNFVIDHKYAYVNVCLFSHHLRYLTSNILVIFLYPQNQSIHITQITPIELPVSIGRSSS